MPSAALSEMRATTNSSIAGAGNGHCQSARFETPGRIETLVLDQQAIKSECLRETWGIMKRRAAFAKRRSRCRVLNRENLGIALQIPRSDGERRGRHGAGGSGEIVAGKEDLPAGGTGGGNPIVRILGTAE